MAGVMEVVEMAMVMWGVAQSSIRAVESSRLTLSKMKETRTRTRAASPTAAKRGHTCCSPTDAGPAAMASYIRGRVLQATDGCHMLGSTHERRLLAAATRLNFTKTELIPAVQVDGVRL